MKNLRTLSILAIFVFAFSFASNAQMMKKVDIKTSVDCEACKDKLEKALNETDGIEKATVNLESNILSVKYSEDKTSYDKIVAKITKLGYSADDKEACSSHKGCCSGHVKTKSDCKDKPKSEVKSSSNSKSDCSNKSKAKSGTGSGC